jgi:phosphatidylethanolamine-binding protein (PEBP) family uncharacterized protein
MSRCVVAVAGLLLLASCATESPPDSHAMAIDVAFGLGNLCGAGVSPQITISNPPAATSKYSVEMRNIDVLLPTPWQATVNANGAVIPEGAGPDYRGPCPGEFQRHRYRFTVTALDAAGRALASAQATDVAVATTLYVQRNQEGNAQPPITGMTAANRFIREQRQASGPDPAAEIGPYLGVVGIQTLMSRAKVGEGWLRRAMPGRAAGDPRSIARGPSG